MKIKKILLTASFFLIAVMAMGQIVTPETAKLRAADMMAKMGKKEVSLSCQMLMRDSMSGQTPLYVFNNGQNQGFVIVSGDERAISILGYSEDGSFDEREMPDNMRAWLEGCANQIMAVKRGKIKSMPLKISQHKAVLPLLTTKWGQGVASKTGRAYNRKCPTINSVYCYTGCVATAMAQVMNYFQWPQKTSRPIPKYTPNSKVGALPELPVREFDWVHMRDIYEGTETQEENDAVGWLMRYCGQAVEMNYGTGSSGASTVNIPQAMKTYFGYDINTRFVFRNDYTADDWDSLIYNEILEGRPVIYKGVSSMYGHSFICDGCDNNGLYHFNWGAEGRYNGYYALTALNPYQGGEGYTGTNDGFTTDQGAVVGIQPVTDETEDLRALHVDYITYYSTKLYALFVNQTGAAGTFEYGFQYHLANDNSGQYKTKKTTATFNNMSQKTFYFDVTSLNLSNGVYRFYPYSKLSTSSTCFVNGNYNFYLEVTISGGVVKTITKHPKSNLTISSLECTGNKVVNMVQEVKVTVTNTGEEFNDIIYLFASRTTTKGEYVNKTGLFVNKNGTGEACLYFTPDATGTWYLWADTDENGKGIAKRIKITIRALPTEETKLEMTECHVNAYPQRTAVTVKVKNNGKDGYFRPLKCMIYSVNDNEYVGYSETANMNIAVAENVQTTFYFDDLVYGKHYQALLYEYVSHQSDEIKRIGTTPFWMNHSGLLGDVDDNGKVDITDVLMTVDHILGRENTTFMTKAADWNVDNINDISDVLNIVDAILGKNKLRYYEP